MHDNLLKTQAFKLKGRFYTFTVLHLLETDIASFTSYLLDVVASAPRLFDKTPIVIDCSSITTDNLDLGAICNSMRQQGLIPVAIQGGSTWLHTLAQTHGLAVLHASTMQDKDIAVENDVVPTPLANESTKTKLLTTPVRSGQQVVSKGGDLIITAAVSHGAELLADGNIHVYGPLRGRALAGIAGDKQARIFCQALDAELVAIAGYYRLRDSIEPMNCPCQIYLHNDHIQIEAL